ncbi:hypothetical protein [Bacillus nakamurai]|uniref:hypothetical protein n=1 Tax=Bacillus nakamurai TaxID=1793963 RepID=UPI0020C3D5DA|nr:hypothetical protein [Bacillus nakamurai]MCP6683201.1 hypothetical protein [Bacillus nakamurai]
MKDFSGVTIDLHGSMIRIIAGNLIVPNSALKWDREDDQDLGRLTLSQISDQLKNLGASPVFYVWTELGLSGAIYIYGNHGEFWEEHGTTKGFA